MMMSKKRNKAFRLIIIITVVVVIIIIGLLILRDIGKNALKNRITEMGSSDKVALLNKLNDEWELPDDYTLQLIETDGLKMEWVQKKAASPVNAILQLHGGAYIHDLSYNGTTYRRSAVQYAKISGAGVLTVDYRVAPKDPYPAALEDAVSAYNWLLDQGYMADNIIIAGDSAGGGLTLATAFYLRDHDMPLPAALITMSAWTNLNYKRYKPDYVGENDPKDPYISPIYGDYHDLPPLLMQAGGDETILNDTLKAAHIAEGDGVSVQQTTYKGMFHVFQMLFPELKEANEAWAEAEDFIKGIFE